MIWINYRNNLEILSLCMKASFLSWTTPLLYSVDQFWANIGDIIQPGNSEEKRLKKLSNLCKVLLVPPYSTADAERLFSMTKKIETEQHSSLPPTTVRNLLSMKINTSHACFQSSRLISPALRSAAKTATDRSLHQDHH